MLLSERRQPARVGRHEHLADTTSFTPVIGVSATVPDASAADVRARSRGWSAPGGGSQRLVHDPALEDDPQVVAGAAAARVSQFNEPRR